MNIFKLLITTILGLFLVACGSDSNPGAPDAPTSVKVVAGTTVGTTASVSFSAPASDGGSSITGYTVTTTPGGITATGTASPIALAGLTPGTSYTFSVVATNSVGKSAAATVNNINNYSLVETFTEPMTSPRNSIFTGTFTYDSISQTVTNLKGILSESMTKPMSATLDGAAGTTPAGYPAMNWVSLNNQLVSWHDATLGGTFAATFKNTNTNTFSIASTAPGGDYWSPKSGVDSGGTYYSYVPGVGGTNPYNAYALIFVPDEPLTSLTQAQIDKLAYADFTQNVGSMMMGGLTQGGMMGSQGMTGTSVAGYGAAGTMSGYPFTQVITKQ